VGSGVNLKPRVNVGELNPTKPNEPGNNEKGRCSEQQKGSQVRGGINA